MKKTFNVFRYVGNTLIAFVIVLFSYINIEQALILMLKNMFTTKNNWHNLNYTNVSYEILLILALLLLIGLIFKILKGHIAKENDLREFAKANSLNVLKSSVVFYLMIVLGNFIISWVSSLMSTPNYSNNQQILNGDFNSGGYKMMFVIILSLFLAPVIEEIMNRFLFLGYLKNKLNLTLNTSGNKYVDKIIILLLLLLSSSTFALLHSPTNIASFLQYFWMGLCLGGIYLKYDSVYASMTLHFMNNALALLTMFLISCF